MLEKKIELNNVDKFYGKRKIINNISFDVFKGDICGFIGPNGAGKTTVIKMLTGLIRPSSGTIQISGMEVQHNREKALSEIGAIIEYPVFFDYMSGRKNLQNLARLNINMTRKEQLDKVEQVLKLVELKTDSVDRGEDKVKTYSLGMKQRLGIAQALLNNPKVVILDEPTNGLDPMGIRDLRKLIIKLQAEYGITFFISSHLLDELQKICNRYVVIKEGTLIWSGKGEELQQRKSNGSLEEIFMELMEGDKRD